MNRHLWLFFKFTNSKSRRYFQNTSLSFLWFQEGLCLNKNEWQYVCLYLNFPFGITVTKNLSQKSLSGHSEFSSLSLPLWQTFRCDGKQAACIRHTVTLHIFEADKSPLMLVFPEPQAPCSHPISPVPWGLLQSFCATYVSSLCEQVWTSNHRKWQRSIGMMAARGWSDTLICHRIAYRSS